MIDDSTKTDIDQVVIPDECEDSMWDTVLGQEVKACDIKNISTNAVSLLIDIDKGKSEIATKSK